MTKPRESDLSLKEVARELGYRPVTIGRALRAGTIKGYRVGGTGNWRVSLEEVQRVRTSRANDD